MAEAVGRHNARGALQSERVRSTGRPGGQHRIHDAEPTQRIAKVGAKGGANAGKRTAQTARRVESARGYGKPTITKAGGPAVQAGTFAAERLQAHSKKAPKQPPYVRVSTGLLAVEYIIAVFIVMLGVLRKDKEYHGKMHAVFFQLTGISAVFFILALVSVGRKSAKFALTFGALIDIAILLFQVQTVDASRKAGDAAILAGTIFVPGGAAIGAGAEAGALQAELDQSYASEEHGPETVVAPQGGITGIVQGS